MDATNKTGQPLRSVKRSYTRKAVLEGGEVVSTKEENAYIPVVAAIESSSLSQLYANRVWDGQSVDLPLHERIERVMTALRGQNLPTEGVFLPSA